ncbi:hypothetical protein [Hymenobacter rigui]|uniref:Uncharacterized protein n=1 Tax=Hymenobacter rigui TaxID=334424 RepID=A0A3R9P777_9BACT|nr:hypothetical protein [Hymenobacter rigui]RSK50320.1 hypothetical protein EI291_06615 [Hymenobacter rigui]
MKPNYWPFLVMVGLAVFQPFIMAGTRRLSEKFLSETQRQLLDKTAQALFILVQSFLTLFGAVTLISIQRNGHKFGMSISYSWLWTVAVTSVCITVLRLLKEKYPVQESL